MDILPFLDFQFTSKIITQGYRYGQCKTGAKRSGLAAYSQCLPSSQKGKLYKSACFQLVSKLPPLQKQFFIFGKCHWFSYMLSGSDLFIFRICLFSDPIKATNHCGSIYFFLILLCCLSFLRDREHSATRNNPCRISLKCPCWVVFKLSLPKSHPSPIKRESSWLQKLLQWSECSVRMEEKVWALKVRKSSFAI